MYDESTKTASVSGGGTYGSGASVTITAKPVSKSYYISSIRGTSISNPEPGKTETVTFNASADETVSVSVGKSYVIMYGKNGGTSSSAAQAQYVVPGKSVTLSSQVFTKTDYVHDGWSTSANGAKTYSFGETITPSKSITLYAHYSPAFTVHFSSNEGELEVRGEMADQSIVSGSTTALSKNVFAIDGYKFAGWNTAADGTGTAYADEADGGGLSSTAGTVVTLYAQWTKLYLFKVTNPDTSIGTLSLLDSDGETIAEEEDGVLLHTCAIGDGVSYTMSATISNYLYGAVKVGGNVLPHSYSATSAGEVVATVEYVLKDVYAVSFANCENGSLSVSSPSSPDRDGKYIAQDITIKATPSDGYHPARYWVYKESDRKTPVHYGSFSGSDTFTIPSAKVNSNLVVYATFEIDNFTVSVDVDNDEHGTAESSAEDPDSVPYGTVVSFTATPTRDDDTGADLYRFTNWTNGDGEAVSEDNPHDVTVTSDVSLTANFIAVSSGQQTVTVKYGMGSIAVGSFSVDGTSNEETGEDVSSTKEFGTSVSISAKVSYGCRFNGWYSDSACTKLIGKSTTIKIYARTRNVYASFSDKGGKVMEWEGSSENKTMTWRSKTYASSRPFNPSSCRVDATGYANLALKVDTFSSPDVGAKATGSATLANIANQDARRLPMRRPERYLQVEVENDAEVDAVLVGTSMGGLAV